jgi:TolB-like protein
LNKRILISFVILISVFNLFSIEKKEENIKRTIMILPFLNKNDVKKYSYLSDSIRDALKAKLLDGDNFILTNLSSIDSKISELGFNKESVMEETNAKQVALKLKADVIVFGKYIIIEDKIMVQIDALDIFTKETIASSTLKGELGLDIFRIIDESVDDIAKKLKAKLTQVKKSYFTEMNRILNRENFTVQNKVGVGLTSGGGSLFLAGLGILIFDLAYYQKILSQNLYNNPRTDIGYNDYQKAYYNNISLLATSITILCIGSSMMAVGIPFVVYKKKNTKVSINFDRNSTVNLEICFDL